MLRIKCYLEERINNRKVKKTFMSTIGTEDQDKNMASNTEAITAIETKKTEIKEQYKKFIGRKILFILFSLILIFIIAGIAVTLGAYSLTVGNAFFFALIPTFIILGLTRYKRATPETMILAGIALFYIFSGLMALLMYFSEAEPAVEAYFWMIGSLGRASWGNLLPASIMLVGCFIPLMWKSRDVNVMGAGDERAKSSEEDTEIVLETLQTLNIEDIAMRDINELSGGQQQKVFIACALTQEPDVLLLDEPTSNLDIRHQLEVMDIIKNVVREKNISAIMAIHDLNLGSRYADRILMMNGGKIFAAGTPSSVLTHENIKHVYGVESEVEEKHGRPYIVPIRPVSQKGGGNGGVSYEV